MLRLRGARPAGRAGSPRSGAEEGFTLIELMVGMTISIILLTLMATMVTVYSKAEASTVNSANAAANVRLTLLQLQNDIQSASPLGTLGTVAAYNDELQMTIQPSNKVITWQYTPTVVPGSSPTAWTGQLTRQVGSSTPEVELTNVTNGDPTAVPPGIPVFSYFDRCGANLVTEAEPTPASISAAIAVQVTLSVANVNSAPYGSTTTVHIMNQPPPGGRC